MVGSEPGTFFVGEERHGQGAQWGHTVFLERLDHLETGENSEVAVETTSRAHGVDM